MKDKHWRTFLITITAFFMVVFCLTPVVFMIVISLSEHPDFLSKQTEFRFTFNNFLNIIFTKNLHFPDYLKNSMAVSGISAIITVIIAALGAYAITRFKFPGKIYILLFILGISMFPQISIVGYIFKVMSNIGWINTYPALIFPYISWTLPLSLWILVSYFSQIPKEIDNAGLIDGCNRIQILIKLILPIAAPGLFSALLLAFISGFNEFLFALMLTTDFHSQTIPVGITLFQGLHGEIPWGNIMAASVISIIPVLILIFIFQKHIVQGLTRGAVKE
ncbi:MAG: carbohydrate ABC transporter permease [bacterium]|nr:carbohydrate ABC transporter permease [bacterium]